MPAAPAPPDPLSRLVTTLESSLPMYLADSGLQTYPGDPEIRGAVADFVADARGILARAVPILDARETPLPRPAYPLSYTALHDLDLAHLLPRLSLDLRRRAEACAAIAAGSDATAAELGGEAEAIVRRHAATLERLAGRSAAPA